MRAVSIISWLAMLAVLTAGCGSTPVDSSVTYMAWGFEAVSPVAVEGDAGSREAAALLLNGRTYVTGLGNKLGEKPAITSTHADSVKGRWEGSYSVFSGDYYGSGSLVRVDDNAVLTQQVSTVSSQTSQPVQPVSLELHYNASEVDLLVRQLGKVRIDRTDNEPVASTGTFTVTGTLSGEIDGRPVDAVITQTWRVLRTDVSVW